MLEGLIERISHFVRNAVRDVGRAAADLLRPRAGLALGLVADMCRSREQLLAENALLRQQLIPVGFSDANAAGGEIVGLPMLGGLHHA